MTMNSVSRIARIALIDAFPLKVASIHSSFQKSEFSEELPSSVAKWPSQWTEFPVELAYQLIQLRWFLESEGILAILPPMMLCFLTDDSDVLDLLLPDLIDSCLAGSAGCPILSSAQRSAVLFIMLLYSWQTTSISRSDYSKPSNAVDKLVLKYKSLVVAFTEQQRQQIQEATGCAPEVLIECAAMRSERSAT